MVVAQGLMEEAAAAAVAEEVVAVAEVAALNVAMIVAIN